MAAWRLDGTPRTARQFAVYKTCPLPTPEDRLFFLLTYLKTYALQVVQGESAKLWGDSGMLGGDDRMSSALSRVILPEKMMYRGPTEKSRIVWKTSRHEPWCT
jgi:hypothetical protein